MDNSSKPHSKLSFEELVKQNTQLKNQVQELQETSKKVEGKYQKIIESSPLGVFLYALEEEDKLIFRGYNKSAETILGVELESLIGKTIEDAFPPLAQTEIPFEYKKTAKTGEEFYTNQVDYDFDKIKGAYEVRAYQVSKNNIAVNFSDITERLEKEIELKESQQKFKSLFDNIEEGVALHKMLFDEDNNPIDFIWVDVNPTYERLTQLKRKDLIGKKGKDVIPNIEKKWYDLYAEVQLTGIPKTVIDHSEYLNKYWEVRIFRPQEGHFAVAMTDVTEKVISEDRIQRSESVQRKMVSNIGDVIVIIDKNGINRYKSPNVKNLFGWEVDELVGNSAWDKVYPDDIESAKKLLAELAYEPLKSLTTELRYSRKDGEYRWIQITISNLLDDPDIKGFLGNYHDITESKQAELALKIKNKELIEAKEKAEEADRLKSAFLANMSHEIRTPMNGILGFTSFLQDTNISVENQNNYIDIIKKSGDRLLNTVNDIIEISKIESGDINVAKSEVDLIKHLDTQVSFFKPEADKKNIEIVVENNVDRNDLKIATDKIKLSSILSNLIKNAIKYTNAGTIKVGFKIENDQILFSCQDTGIGIPKNRQEAIFNRFEQADIEDKHAHQGSGLGLAIVKTYVEMLDGKIWVKSEEGQGSIFYVSLPYEPEKKKKQVLPQEVKSSDSDIKNINVLIAEDEEYSSIHLSIIMKDKVKNIKKAENGVEAIETLKNDSSIDLILMDLKMPVVDGIKATKKIREFNKDVIIIAQTAYALEGDKEKALLAGCNDYISKPIKKDILFEMINKYF